MADIGLMDVDGHNYPNLPLMKLSAWHKNNGDNVEMYDFCTRYDRVYMSKVFSFTPDYEHYINCEDVIRGGTGYAIWKENGIEKYHQEYDIPLNDMIEHMYPDYSLYPQQTKDTAYGFTSRGCPRGCDFCHVAGKEGRRSRKVADVSEFWDGQKNIVLCDPNLLACPEHIDILEQLIDTDAYVDFNQGLDCRLLTDSNLELIRQIKLKQVHFAFDRYEDKDEVLPKLRMFKEITGIDKRKCGVYILVNFDTTFEQDLERVEAVREIGLSPFVMVYDKQNTQPTDSCRQLQRYVNNRILFNTAKSFYDVDMSLRRKH